MKKKCLYFITQTNEVLPLFLIDSEGMGVRGEAFDFITTSPPAVIAKVKQYFLFAPNYKCCTYYVSNFIGNYLDWCRKSSDCGNS